MPYQEGVKKKKSSYGAETWGMSGSTVGDTARGTAKLQPAPAPSDKPDTRMSSPYEAPDTRMSSPYEAPDTRMSSPYEAPDTRMSTAYAPDGKLKTDVAARTNAQVDTRMSNPYEAVNQRMSIAYEQEMIKIQEPGGWKNLDLNLAARGGVWASVGKALDWYASLEPQKYDAEGNRVYTTSPMMIGPTMVGQVASSLIGSTLKSQVDDLARVGVLKFGTVPSSAAGFATNTASQKATASMLMKMVKVAKNPQFVVGMLLSTIGSYPFAGFIKEESLQTLSMGVKAAIENKDVAGAEAALALQDEILNPGLWDQIKAKIPFVNVLDNLNDFYRSAVIKASVDKAIVRELKRAQDPAGDGSVPPETSDEFWTRIEEERVTAKDAERQADTEYYAMVAKRVDEAKAQGRLEDEAYWAKIYAEQDERAKKKQAAEEEFYGEFYRSYNDYAYEAPSKLVFGLL